MAEKRTIQDLQYYFDIVSPNAYLGEVMLRRLEAEHNLHFERKPILLGGLMKVLGTQPPFIALQSAPQKLAHYRYEMQRYAERNDIAFQVNPHFPLLTLAVQRLCLSAKAINCEGEFLTSFYRAMWVECLPIDKPDIIEQILREAELPADDLLAHAKTPENKRALMEETKRAHAKGVFGAPTIFVGEELFFGKDSLDQVRRELVHQNIVEGRTS